MKLSYKNRRTHGRRQPSNTSTAGYHLDLRVLDRNLTSPIVTATERNMTMIISPLTYEYDIDRKAARLIAITDKLNDLLTPKDIYDGIHRGITNYYNITMQEKGKQSNNTSIVAQDISGWQHFCRGRVSKKRTSAMKKHYSQHSDNPNFTGRGWTKQIIDLVLTIHVEE